MRGSCRSRSHLKADLALTGQCTHILLITVRRSFEQSACMHGCVDIPVVQAYRGACGHMCAHVMCVCTWCVSVFMCAHTHTHHTQKLYTDTGCPEALWRDKGPDRKGPMTEGGSLQLASPLFSSSGPSFILSCPKNPENL